MLRTSVKRARMMYEHREVEVILEGSVQIEIAHVGTLDIGVGDLFSLPPGAEMTWQITTPYKEMWVLASDRAAWRVQESP